MEEVIVGAAAMFDARLLGCAVASVCDCVCNADVAVWVDSCRAWSTSAARIEACADCRRLTMVYPVPSTFAVCGGVGLLVLLLVAAAAAPDETVPSGGLPEEVVWAAGVSAMAIS